MQNRKQAFVNGHSTNSLQGEILNNIKVISEYDIFQLLYYNSVREQL